MKSILTCCGMAIHRTNQVWALDTTYIRLAKGFAYLTAVVDWTSRKVLTAKLAITLEACHAIDVLQDAFRRYGTPEIVNTDQGSQFTAQAFVNSLGPPLLAELNYIVSRLLIIQIRIESS